MSELIRRISDYRITEVRQIQKITFWVTLVLFLFFSVYIFARI
ncbi:MAG: hypothetical protein ACXVNR_02535 [Bacteroidia bacterium]